MTALKPYPDYKDSGVNWFGELPAHWQTRATKRMIREISDKGYPDLPLLAATQSMGVVRKDRYGQRTVLAMSNLESLKRVRVDDFVISLRSFQGGIERAYDEGILSSAYTVLRHDRRLLDVGYLARLFKSKPFLGELELNVTGIREGQNINYSSLRETHLPLPPLDEQRAIADFLDGMDARITRFIAARRKMIVLLEEKKQAVINQAVTRGLDPSVPMKDSGVDWLGEIPAHWDVRKVGALTTLIQTGPFGSQLPASEYMDDGVPLINPSHIAGGKIVPDSRVAVSDTTAERLSRHRFKIGDIALARRGEMGRCAVALPENKGWLCGTGTLLVRPNSEFITPEYLQQVLSHKSLAGWLELTSAGATMSNLNTTMVASIGAPVPPIDEQNAIVEHVGSQTHGVELLISRHQREIELIQEYRTRLISDVITGKLDVRGVQLPAVEDVIGEEIEAAMETEVTEASIA